MRHQNFSSPLEKNPPSLIVDSARQIEWLDVRLNRLLMHLGVLIHVIILRCENRILVLVRAMITVVCFVKTFLSFGPGSITSLVVTAAR